MLTTHSQTDGNSYSLPEDFKKRLFAQKEFFNSGQSLPLSFRKQNLKKLLAVIQKFESRILIALKKDLGKCNFEAYTSEVAFVKSEIRHVHRYLNSWARPQKKSLPFHQFGAKSAIYFRPYGHSLIIAPWNYPFQLLMSPAVGAMAAGNVLCLKPSEFTPHTEEVIQQLIGENFDPAYIDVFRGEASLSQNLVSHPFDHIFFTGSSQVGQKIMSAAAKNLTPLVLELGGKSPCILDATAKFPVSARRIFWGKAVNAGQTCVAPDYLLIHESKLEKFVSEWRQIKANFYSDSMISSQDYGRIVNHRHFDRLTQMLKGAQVIEGGDTNREKLFIEPTLLHWPDTPNHLLCSEEIFGPLLPIKTFRQESEIFNEIRSRPTPLALYLFSENKQFQKRITESLAFGGGAINDTLTHLLVPDLPFGGLGQSGLGQYHGRHSFETFSHKQGILKRTTWFDPSLRYPPYKNKFSLVRRLLR